MNILIKLCYLWFITVSDDQEDTADEDNVEGAWDAALDVAVVALGELALTLDFADETCNVLWLPAIVVVVGVKISEDSVEGCFGKFPELVGNGFPLGTKLLEDMGVALELPEFVDAVWTVLETVDVEKRVLLEASCHIVEDEDSGNEDEASVEVESPSDVVEDSAALVLKPAGVWVTFRVLLVLLEACCCGVVEAWSKLVEVASGGWEKLVVSLDGGGLEAFPDPMIIGMTTVVDATVEPFDDTLIDTAGVDVTAWDVVGVLLANVVELGLPTSEVLEACCVLEDSASCDGTIDVLIGAATVLVDAPAFISVGNVGDVWDWAVDRTDDVDEDCVDDVTVASGVVSHEGCCAGVEFSALDIEVELEGVEFSIDGFEDGGMADVELLTSNELDAETDCPPINVVVGATLVVSASVELMISGTATDDSSVNACEIPAVDAGVGTNEAIDDAVAADWPDDGWVSGATVVENKLETGGSGESDAEACVVVDDTETSVEDICDRAGILISTKKNADAIARL
jgi:hypothetical protein